MKKCRACRNDFDETGRSRAQTCSETCRLLYIARYKVGKYCKICNSPFMIPKSRMERSFYCSRKCYEVSESHDTIPNCECNVCGKGFYKAPSLQITHTYHYCSQFCMGEHYRDRFTGENSPTWRGGKRNYYGKNWFYMRDEARKRDDFQCQKCGVDEEEYGQQLSVHHITPFVYYSSYAEANKLSNLLSVCEPCHRKIHTGDNHPSKFKIPPPR